MRVWACLGKFNPQQHCINSIPSGILGRQEEVIATTPLLQGGEVRGPSCSKRYWAATSYIQPTAKHHCSDFHCTDAGTSPENCATDLWRRSCCLCMWGVLFKCRWQSRHFFSHLPLSSSVPPPPCFWLWESLRCCNCSDIEDIWRTVTTSKKAPKNIYNRVFKAQGIIRKQGNNVMSKERSGGKLFRLTKDVFLIFTVPKYRSRTASFIHKRMVRTHKMLRGKT